MDNTMRALPSISLILIATGMMSTLFKTAAAFNLPLRYGPRTSSAVARHLKSSIAQTNQVCAARFIQLNGCYSICERQYKCALTQLFSTSADINLSTPTAFKKESYPNALHTVVVHRNKQSLAFREGTPLVFTKSIAATYSEVLDDSVEDLDDIPLGALVAVVVSKDKQSDKTKRDTKNSVKSHSHYTFTDKDEYTALINQSQTIGYGVYNPHSMYRVRMLLHETIHPGLTKDIRSLRKEMQRGAVFSENDALKSILEKKITDAIRLRMAMNLPSFDTDTYRLINGEGDGLSGLAVDIIGGNTAIVMSSAAWCEIHKDTILYILSKSLALHPSYENETVDIVWRNTPSRLAQDGYELVQEIERESEDVSVIATESSIKYMTYPYSDGQKTGFYCDQRDNRRTIAKYCENKRVLDLCCYSGGFSLNAVIHGNAASAVGVDSSQDAVDSCTENARLNGLDENSISFVRDDIAAFMKNAIDRNEQYDVVILDPPKLAPSISTLTKASRKYHSLNRDAMNLIDKTRGGLLLTCTCSAAMTQSNGGQFFLGVVNSAALSAKRQATLMAVNGAAPCHTQSPASFPAGNYLTCALFFIGPVE